MPPMVDILHTNEIYRIGRNHSKAERYEEALDAFNQAHALGDRSWKLYDAKAEAMSHLGEAMQQSAWEIAKSLCKKFGKNSHRPWYRSATILIAQNKVDAAELHISKGLSMVPGGPHRASFLELQAQCSGLRVQLMGEQTEPESSTSNIPEIPDKYGRCVTQLLPAEVLILIAEMGLCDDPNIAIRMGAVCTQWRRLTQEHSFLWSRLTLGKRRPITKIKYWTERSKGRLFELIMTAHVPAELRGTVAEQLQPVVPQVVKLVIHGYVEAYTFPWHEKFLALKSLLVKNDNTSRAESPFLFGLLHPDAQALESVDVGFAVISRRRPENLLLNGPDGPVDQTSYWLPKASSQLKSLHTLRIRSGVVVSSEMTLQRLVEHTPLLKELSLGCSWVFRDQTIEDDMIVDLPNLAQMELTDAAATGIPSNRLFTPNMTNLSFYGWSSARHSVLSQMSGPGLTAARRNLTSLDIGKCVVEQSVLLDLLSELKSLKFLNVSFCGLNNSFLEALVVENSTEKPLLLPNLTALSIAGHDNISAGPLRRMILSRHPNGPILMPQVKAVLPKRSAFAPTRPIAKAGLSTPIKSTAPLIGNDRPKVTAIKWICVDLCNHPDMNVHVLDSLRPLVGFLSNRGAPVVTDRIRGVRAYAWDLEYTDDCTRGEGACHKRKRRSDDDIWYIHHSCKHASVA